MIRESDEECLTLIASMREREDLGFDFQPSDVASLLGNLEARIAEASAVDGALPLRDAEIRDLRAERDGYSSENLRLHAQLAAAGKQLEHLGPEVVRYRMKSGEQEPRERLTLGKLKSALQPLMDRDLAHQGTGWNQSLGYWMCGLFVDAMTSVSRFP